MRAGAVEVTAVTTNAWGDRGSRIRDPFGNLWWVQTHVEDVSEDEMAARMTQQHHLDDMAFSEETLDHELRLHAT